jgi:hypothetical protein
VLAREVAGEKSWPQMTQVAVLTGGEIKGLETVRLSDVISIFVIFSVP